MCVWLGDKKNTKFVFHGFGFWVKDKKNWVLGVNVWYFFLEKRERFTPNENTRSRALSQRRRKTAADRCVSCASWYLHGRTASRCVCPETLTWSSWRVCCSLARAISRPWYDVMWALLTSLIKIELYTRITQFCLGGRGLYWWVSLKIEN